MEKEEKQDKRGKDAKGQNDYSFYAIYFCPHSSLPVSCQTLSHFLGAHQKGWLWVWSSSWVILDPLPRIQNDPKFSLFIAIHAIGHSPGSPPSRRGSEKDDKKEKACLTLGTIYPFLIRWNLWHKARDNKQEERQSLPLIAYSAKRPPFILLIPLALRVPENEL